MKIGSNVNGVWFILYLGYNFKLCVFESFLVIWNFRTHKVYCCKKKFNANFVYAYCCVYSIMCFGLGFLQVLQMSSVTTLTLSLWLNVECKGMWGQENVFENETHSHKCEIM